MVVGAVTADAAAVVHLVPTDLFIGERFVFVVESFEAGRSRFRSMRTRRPVAVLLRGRAGCGGLVAGEAAVARWIRGWLGVPTD